MTICCVLTLAVAFVGVYMELDKCVKIFSLIPSQGAPFSLSFHRERVLCECEPRYILPVHQSLRQDVLGLTFDSHNPYPIGIKALWHIYGGL